MKRRGDSAKVVWALSGESAAPCEEVGMSGRSGMVRRLLIYFDRSGTKGVGTLCSPCKLHLNDQEKRGARVGVGRWA